MASAHYGVYNPKDCEVTVDGVSITGFSEDLVSSGKSEDWFSVTVGAKGDTVKNMIYNKLGEVSLHLHATSPSVPFLRGLSGQPEDFPVWITNKSLQIRCGGTTAAIKTAPPFDQGKEVGTQTFVFQVFDYTEEAI